MVFNSVLNSMVTMAITPMLGTPHMFQGEQLDCTHHGWWFFFSLAGMFTSARSKIAFNHIYQKMVFQVSSFDEEGLESRIEDDQCRCILTWLVVWLPFFGIFPLILGISSSLNWRSHIFQEGWPSNHQPVTFLKDLDKDQPNSPLKIP